MRRGARLLVEGVVQGVGFRPFVYRLAHQHNLSGWVLNSSTGVVIEVEGEDSAVEEFVSSVKGQAPPIARIEGLQVTFNEPKGYSAFEIRKSQDEGEGIYTFVASDVSVCNECLDELRDKSDRRFQYPFITCTNCGPRFTIIEDMPYDRPMTTMRPFKMCTSCMKEYSDPLDRRFHAQPNGCPVCGPRVFLEAGGRTEWEHPIPKAVELLESGKVLGIKGLGGFHLACNASDDKAVARIRDWKFREAKPFALMSSSLERIGEYCHMDAEEERLLTSPLRPIVLMRKREDARLSEHIAPGNRYLGVMLPYTPLHHLLLDTTLQALVMTSGNRGGNPIISDNDEARGELDVADAILSHERDIRSKCDDSVTRVMQGQEVLVRRSRGYTPFPVRLSLDLQRTLACGADLKNTFCLAKGCYAFLSQHIGDLENARTFDAYREMIEQCKTLFRITPELIAHDLHPDYFSTRYALEQDLPRVGVQHHHAHIASCMAEHRLDGRVIGLAFDGTGYGPDGTIWGGEFLTAGLDVYERKGHLATVRMPGGESAIKNPWRMAFSHLYNVFGEELLEKDLAFLGARDDDVNELMVAQLKRGLNAPLTSSCGRLFDAVASLIGLRQTVTYDGQAAIELENIARSDVEGSYGYELVDRDGTTVVDTGSIITDLLEDLKNCVPSTTMASRFHVTMAELATEMCCMIRDEEALDRVVLSGGVFQNALLTDLLCSRLEKNGFTPILHKLVPPNDGGICLGQVAVANAGRER